MSAPADGQDPAAANATQSAAKYVPTAVRPPARGKPPAPLPPPPPEPAVQSGSPGSAAVETANKQELAAKKAEKESTHRTEGPVNERVNGKQQLCDDTVVSGNAAVEALRNRSRSSLDVSSSGAKVAPTPPKRRKAKLRPSSSFVAESPSLYRTEMSSSARTPGSPAQVSNKGN